MAKPTAGQIGPSKSGDQAIVSSAGADCILRSEIFCQHFKDRLIVIIEASDDFVVDHIGDLDQIEQMAELLKVWRASGVKWLRIEGAP